MRKELRRVVRVSKLMAKVSETRMASIPSVSSRTVTKSWHSRTVVAIQMPLVQAYMLWPSLKAPGLPSIRDMYCCDRPGPLSVCLRRSSPCSYPGHDPSRAHELNQSGSLLGYRAMHQRLLTIYEYQGITFPVQYYNS